jgi:hypothetical protein
VLVVAAATRPGLVMGHLAWVRARSLRLAA